MGLDKKTKNKSKEKEDIRVEGGIGRFNPRTFPSMTRRYTREHKKIASLMLLCRGGDMWRVLGSQVSIIPDSYLIQMI